MTRLKYLLAIWLLYFISRPNWLGLWLQNYRISTITEPTQLQNYRILSGFQNTAKTFGDKIHGMATCIFKILFCHDQMRNLVSLQYYPVYLTVSPLVYLIDACLKRTKEI